MAGRPTKYKKEYNDQVIKLCRLGATDKDIADFFDVKEQTVNNWKKSEPAFFESLKKGKIISDTNISESLYNKALGYYYTEEKEVRVKDYDDQGKQIERVEVVELQKYVPADTTAQIFWLKNRRKDQWRDKQDVQVEGGIQVVYADKRAEKL